MLERDFLLEAFNAVAIQLSAMSGDAVCIKAVTWGPYNFEESEYQIWSSKLKKFFFGKTMAEAVGKFQEAFNVYPAAQRLLDEAATEAMKGE